MAVHLNEIPDRFLCKISHEVMQDPVRYPGCHPNHVFERSFITRHYDSEHYPSIRGRRLICPFRDQSFYADELNSLTELKNEIEQCRRLQPELFQQESEEEMMGQLIAQEQMRMQEMINRHRREARENTGHTENMVRTEQTMPEEPRPALRIANDAPQPARASCCLSNCFSQFASIIAFAFQSCISAMKDILGEGLRLLRS
ncbi:MAG: hypothetical protein Tsb0015_15470 [Simkaniaceae bacterium]